MASTWTGWVARFFRWELANPKKILAACTVFLVATAQYLPTLEKDLRSDAFLAPDHPARLYRDVVKDQFGLTDPLIIAVVTSRPEGIYRPDVLRLLSELSEMVARLDNINADRVVSIATENNIIATTEGMDITPFLAEFPQSGAQAKKLRDDLAQFPLYLGTLASRDGSVALITAGLLDEDLAEATYREARQLLASYALPENTTVHLAGEGAVMGYLASYVDADARQLIPLVGVMMILILAIAFRRATAVAACVLLVCATLATTLGLMAAAEIPVYVISNALPVVLVGIAVADGIHIFTYDAGLQRADSFCDRREKVVATMAAMWRPVSLTTLTTMAGFLALYFGGFMPPFKYFGLFAALGVAVAWLYSMTLLPLALSWSHPILESTASSRLSGALGALGSLVSAFAGGSCLWR